MPCDEYLTISQMCEAFQVTARTLRFYEARGLLAPTRQGQHRIYGRRERGRLKLIMRGRRYGFSLDDISSLLELYEPNGENFDQLTAALERGRERLAEMRNQQIELNELIASLEKQILEVEEIRQRLAKTKTHQRAKDDP